MKKLLYSFMGCAALLTVGSASGREALAQAFDNVRATMADDESHPGEYLRSASVVDLSVKFNGTVDGVDLQFTSPRIASWSVTWDYEEIASVDYIRVYRNEGEYYSEEGRELVQEWTNVPSATDISWTDETKLQHGKTYYYMVIPGIGENDGQTAGYSVKVGYTIDPATEYEVLPGEKGAKEATVKFTAPTTANDGTVQVTTPIDSIQITRKSQSWYATETVIHTFKDVAPGEKITYTDRDTEDLEEGERYDYRAILYWDGSFTRNYNNVETVLMGQDKPAAPGNIVATVQEDGNVLVTWEAPTKGVDGGWFNPEAVTYKVERGVPSGYSYSYTVLAENIDALEFVDDQISEEGKYRYQVTSLLNGKDSRSDASDDIIAGPPAGMPFYESWKDNDPMHSTWVATSDWSTSSGKTIYDSDYNTVCEITPVDYDGGMMLLAPYAYNNEVGDVETLESGRIDFSDVVDPILKFSYFDLDPQYTANIMKVYVAADGGEYVELTDVDCTTLPGLNQWVTMTAGLSQFAGAEYITLKFEVVLGENFGSTVIDAVEIRERQQLDLVVKSVSAPVKFYPGAEMTVSVTIENASDVDSDPFALMLDLSGDDFGYGECEGIPAWSSAVVAIPVYILDDTEAGEKTITVNVEGGWETDMSNNTGSTDVVVVALPAVTTLSHDVDDTALIHTLSWEAVEELPFFDGDVETTEDFSAYEHGVTTAFGAWTVIDGDGADTYNIPGATNDYPSQQQPTGGMVLSPTQLGTPWDTPVPGGQCFIFVGASSKANDWLISPELNGAAQTITFKAMAPASWGAESYRFMISSSDNMPDSFTEFAQGRLEGSNGEMWEDLSFEVPAGTKYFAINVVTSYGDALCLTDFNFVVGSGLLSEPTEHLGYNVYCNETKVNDEPLTETTYQLPEDAESGNYTVKAVYNNAESFASEPVYIDTTSAGIDAAQAAALLTVDGNTLVISATGAYTVADLAGRTVAVGEGAARVTVATGTYVVAVDGVVFKVAVK